MTKPEQPSVRFNILGTLECLTSDGKQLPTGGTVQERVLVLLLLSPDRVLPVSRLVDAVWDEEPPATATHQVRKAVAELRRRIPGGRELIVTEGPGYRIALEPGQSDLAVFSDLLGQARDQAAADLPESAVDTLREALALWRGPVLVGAGGSVITTASAALEDRRLAALELFFELRLGLGETGELVGDLRDLVAAHPYQETLCGQLMLALYRSGRQSEALAEYTRMRDVLVDQLGVDPDGRLTALYEGILRNSPELGAPPRRKRTALPAEAGTAAPARHTPPVPTAPAAPAPLPAAAPTNHPHRCTLPYDLPDFTGRKRELQQMLADPDEPDGWPGSRIMAIDGMGGSGKTSLAIRVAHRLAGQYPDAHLYLDLRGYTPGESPLSPGAVAEGLLRMLDVPGDRIPDDEAGRIALWRTTATQYRLLLLLDNAIDSAQIQPLLPASADVLVLITSRARLVDLDGVEWISLGGMPPEDSTALVSRTLGEERTSAEPQAVGELVELCAHLPLALRIAAARLRNRPRWTVQYLVDRLGDETRRLDELRSGTRGVTATLNLTYQGLSPAHQAAFQLLDSHPGAEFDPYSAAALLDTDPAEAEDVLEHLLDTHLMQQFETGRYVFHDLVRSFAKWLRGQAGEDPAEVDQRAVERLLDYYVAATEAACDVAFPGRAPFAPEPDGTPRATVVLPALHDPVRVRQWLDREEENLLAAVRLAQRRDLHRHSAELSRNVVFQLDTRGRFEEFREVAGIAVAASRELGNRYLLALSLSNLAVADWKLGRFTEGLTTAQESLELSVRLGDQRGEAKSTGMLGLLLATLGRFGEALPQLEQSIALKRQLGTPRAEAESLTNLSSLFEHMGRHAEAAATAQRSVELNQHIGARENEIVALTDLALAYLGLGRDDDARTCLDRALGLCDESAPLGDSALVLALSARVRHGRRAPGQAAADAETAAYEEQALKLTRGPCAPIRQAAVWNILGALRHQSGDHAEARQLHSDAHRIASAVGYRIEVARALSGLADVLAAQGDTAAAEAHRSEAAELLKAMNESAARLSS